MYNQFAMSPVAQKIAILATKNQPNNPQISLCEREIASMIQVNFWAAEDLSIVEQWQSKGYEVLHCAPMTYWVVSKELDLLEEVQRHLSDEIAVCTDLSQSRTVFRLSGPNACKLLNKGMAIDFDDPRHGVGCSFQTSVAHMGVACHRVAEDCFHLYVFRGFGLSFLDWVVHAGFDLEMTIS